MDLHVLFCFFFVFAFVLITFTLGLPLCIKIVVLFSFVFTCCFILFLCKLQSINFIDISKFIPELSLQRTFLVSKELSFFYFTFRTKLFFFYFLHFAQNSFYFLILYCLAATRRRFLFYLVFFALHFYLFYFGVFYYLLSGNKLNIFLCIKTFSMPFPFFFLFLCSALLLHFVAFFASTTSLQFSVFFRCSQRAMQETQPTRSKAKFQLNQRTVQTDREPNKPNEPNE